MSKWNIWTAMFTTMWALQQYLYYFIACITDLYGIRCPAMCNKNCAYPGICSPITGECKNGCTVGWRGLTCEESKETYFFVINTYGNAEVYSLRQRGYTCTIIKKRVWFLNG